MTTTDRRWDTDARGHGVRDAAVAAPPLERLLGAMLAPEWVAEDAEHHLLPHLRTAGVETGVDVVRAETIDDVLEIDVAAEGRQLGELRRIVVTLAASVAEASTHIRQLSATEFEVVTGMLAGDADFAPHGHLLRIRLV